MREADLIILDKVIKIDIDKFKELKTLIMFLSEFISGSILYKLHLKFVNQKDEQTNPTLGIKLFQITTQFSSTIDSIYKIYFFIFIISFLDFIGFCITTFDIPEFSGFSLTLETRLQCLLALQSSLLCYFLLKIPIYRHQKCSLIFIFMCLIIVIASEYHFFLKIYPEIEIKHLTLLLLFIFIQDLFYSFIDIVEKYLLEYDFINPFQMLMFEGLFGFAMTLVFSFINNPFKNIDIINSTRKVFLFIICIILYFVLSGVYNCYRVFINKLYSPTTLSLTYCFFDSFFIIFYNIVGDDCLKDNKNYLISNLLLSFFIDFCICIYNELFVFFCFDLERDTYLQISKRSNSDINGSFSDKIKDLKLY